MITYVVSNLLQSPAKVLVNTVNTVGVMGKGIAKDFKNIYPDMFKEYQYLCEKKLLNIGQLWLYKTPHKWILNFPTKQHWRSPSKIEFINAGLKRFVETYAEKGITSVSFPLLGCGNGGLNWEYEVKPLMEKYLANLPIDVFIHLYRKDPFAPEHVNISEVKQWLRNKPQDLGFVEVWDDIKKLLKFKSDFITLDRSKQFKSTIVDNPDIGLEISDDQNKIFIHEDQILDLWQHLRGFGFCMDKTMPSGLDKNAKYLITIMSELPYLKPVLIGDSNQKANKLEIGLQFIPKADYTNRGILQPPPMEVKRI